MGSRCPNRLAGWCSRFFSRVSEFRLSRDQVGGSSGGKPRGMLQRMPIVRVIRVFAYPTRKPLQIPEHLLPFMLRDVSSVRIPPVNHTIMQPLPFFNEVLISMPSEVHDIPSIVPSQSTERKKKYIYYNVPIAVHWKPLVINIRLGIIFYLACLYALAL